MSMPSSPPPLPEELFNDPPSSPPLPPASYPSRKRHADYESSLSSDPIFSEDASEDSDLNGGFKKKKYTKAPWFKHAPPACLRVVASTSQNADSGVWMGSDSSTDSIGGCDKRVQTLSFQDFTVKRAPAMAPAAKARGPEQIAADLVFRCVDACKETIDLSEMCLRTIPNEVLRPLHQLIRLPIDMNDTQKITADHYAPLTPEIKLFLAKNELVALPTELWNLGNITVLSLRNNELTEMPPFVFRLRNLQELNIAGNQLKWLPWELLDLMTPQNRKLVQLHLSPNPFIQPLETSLPAGLGRSRIPNSARECAKAIRKLRARYPWALQSESSYEALWLRLHEARLHRAVNNAKAAGSDGATSADFADKDPRPIYVASSKTIFLDIVGSTLRSPISSRPRAEPAITATLTPTPLPYSKPSAAPSLFELSARACARSPFISQLSSLLPDDASPLVANGLRKAIESKDVGLPNCSVCRKQYVVARAQWIEFWFDGYGSGEKFLPFLRKACSWRCVQTLGDARLQEEAARQEVVARVDASLQCATDADTMDFF